MLHAILLAAAPSSAAVPSRAQIGGPRINGVTGVAGDRESHKVALLNVAAAQKVRPPPSDARHAMIRASAHDSSDVDGSATVNGDVAIAGSAVVSAKERLRSDTM